ncbi:MAG TPA: metal-binding protein [Rhodocyclaceae bacterium]|nr:MAG: hypothetical protein AUK49_00405 [Betaproteobacteria bacterium CG2_30_68_42]PIV74211.1 MAG: metal-binding protein [Rhodocyclales bacterium CG17_big_fil_post_rev_8_21_14_2_50_68_7]PIX74765.1 MAG: metal-binding protein [Rhodocyclales bacterium CG_4_10_14_3_um_filter_68_10]HCX32530.1 metal-binding protein [Rhodocyclaceae bacterium]
MRVMMKRRHLLGAMATTAIVGLARSLASAAGPAEVVVFKDPACGCCGKWVEHLSRDGFKVKTVDSRDMAAVKKRLGVPDALGSCHTAQVGGYVVEGHVPASSIRRLLRDKPAVAGLAVPGMVSGSPGMEEAGKKQPFDVVYFDRAGRTGVFERVR